MMLRVILVAVCLFCSIDVPVAYSKDVPSSIKVLQKTNGAFKDLAEWLRAHFKEINDEEMQPEDIIEIQKVDLSKQSETYFILSRSRSGSGGTGGYLVEKTSDGYTLIYDGFEFSTLSTTTNGYKDIEEHSQSGAGNNYDTVYKFIGSGYEKMFSTEYGYNPVFDIDLSEHEKSMKGTIWTYKYIEGIGNPRSGILSGTIKKIITLSKDPKNKILIIEDGDKDLLALLVSNKGVDIIKSRFRDYKTAMLDFEWKAIAYTDGSPRDNVLTITNVRR